MASECMRAGRNKMALEVLERGLKLHPTLRSARTLKGRALISLGKTEQARELLEGLVRADADNLLAKRLLNKVGPGFQKAEAPGVKKAGGPAAGAGSGPEKTAAASPDAQRVKTLEKWLGNAARMRKG
jgi:tetratricopeptide (TPR) repeat protein